MEAEYKKEKNELESLQRTLEEYNEEISAKKAEIGQAELEVDNVKADNSDIDKELSTSEKKFMQQEQIESRNAIKRHSLLHECLFF